MGNSARNLRTRLLALVIPELQNRQFIWLLVFTPMPLMFFRRLCKLDISLVWPVNSRWPHKVRHQILLVHSVKVSEPQRITLNRLQRSPSPQNSPTMTFSQRPPGSAAASSSATMISFPSSTISCLQFLSVALAPSTPISICVDTRTVGSEHGVIAFVGVG